MRVDGRTLYRARHERFDYAHNHHIVLEYDQERLLRARSRSFQLFARPGNRLADRHPASGGRGVLHAAVSASPPAGDAFAVDKPHVVERFGVFEAEISDVGGEGDFLAGFVVEFKVLNDFLRFEEVIVTDIDAARE